MPLHLCSIHQQCLYTLVQHISNAFTSLFNTPAMRLHSCSTRQQCVYTLVQHSSNAFTSLFNIPAMRLHPCSTFQQYVYTLVQHSSNTCTPLFNKSAIHLHHCSTNQQCVITPFFSEPATCTIYTVLQQPPAHLNLCSTISNALTPLSFLFEKVVVCGHCLVTLSITSYWNIKMALIAVHLNAGVILVVTV